MYKSSDLASQFIELAPLMIRKVKAEIRLAAQGRITHPQFRILANINRGSNTVSQIALDHGVSQPGMSKMVDVLVVKGFIKRTVQAKDRRQVVLKLSTKGLSLFKGLKKEAAENLGLKLKQLPPLEQKYLAEALLHLDRILKLLRQASEDSL